MRFPIPVIQLSAPLRAVYAAERKGFAEIPEGTVLKIIADDASFEPFTVVDWNGSTFLVFPEDLIERGVVYQLRAA
jgi:hypothetical protein